jgi:hypothetical protein
MEQPELVAEGIAADLEARGLLPGRSRAAPFFYTPPFSLLASRDLRLVAVSLTRDYTC